MVTIDGMPIVSALATVYGLFGLPSQLVERVEVVKGPTSGLYGSEAVGGLINIIIKEADKAPLFSGQVMTTSWAEHNAGGAVKATPENPYALTFDPTYVYAPNQGRRVFLGVRYQVK